MTARQRTGLRMAAVEGRDGGLHEVRELAREMVVKLQAQIRQMTALTQAH